MYKKINLKLIKHIFKTRPYNSKRNQAMVKLICPGCNKEFEVKEYNVEMGRKYCTMKCYRNLQ